MVENSPLTKEELLTAIRSALDVIRPEFDDVSYEAVVRFGEELIMQLIMQ